ncbi:MAG: hypothetical protein WC785_04720 [Tatlockia sp.]|jgi:hypothetical protein
MFFEPNTNKEVAPRDANRKMGPLSDRKMTTLFNYDGHSEMLSSLKNRSDQTGEAFFKAFVQRADQRHGHQSMSSKVIAN